MTSRKRSRRDSDDEKQEGGKGKVGGDPITTFIRNTFNVNAQTNTTQPTLAGRPSRGHRLLTHPLTHSSLSICLSFLVQMVSDPSTDHIVRWTDDGSAFLVLDEFAFAKQLLPLYFRHKNFSSFIRQLNFYNFQKRGVDGKYIRLQHPYFKRNQLHLLQLIKRKSTHETQNNVKATVASLTAQVKELKGQYDDLFKIQQQILYIFSRYMRANPIPRSLAGGRERLMLGGEEEEGGVGGSGELLPHPNVELVEDDEDDGDDRRRADDHRDDEVDQVSESKHSALGSMEEHSDEGEVEQFDDTGEGGGLDDEEEVGNEEENKETSEATAQAFAELQNLQDIIDQMPGKQEFLSSIPPIPSPSERPNKRRARAASPPAASTDATSSATPIVPKYEPYAYQPTTPPAAMSTFNAFPVTDASVALPPLYPSQSYINQQNATAAADTAAVPAQYITSSYGSRNKPKLLYSQEHYDALTNRDAHQHSDDENKHSSSQQLPLGDPALYGGGHSYNSWSAPSEHKDNEPLSASLFTPSNVRQNSWMPADMPPGSPHLVNYLNADDSTAESEYGMSSLPLSGESNEHGAAQTAGTAGHGVQYGAWPPYHF